MARTEPACGTDLKEATEKEGRHRLEKLEMGRRCLWNLLRACFPLTGEKHFFSLVFKTGCCWVIFEPVNWRYLPLICSCLLEKIVLVFGLANMIASHLLSVQDRTSKREGRPGRTSGAASHCSLLKTMSNQSFWMIASVVKAKKHWSVMQKCSVNKILWKPSFLFDS